MQLSITTIVAALATFHIANASWKITAFSNGACTLNAEDINSLSRELSSSESVPDCFTFGQDMPGTSCTEAYPATSTTGPCNSGPLNPKSIRAEGNCVFYTEANCGGSEAGVTLPGTPTCVDNGADIMFSLQSGLIRHISVDSVARFRIGKSC